MGCVLDRTGLLTDADALLFEEIEPLWTLEGLVARLSPVPSPIISLPLPLPPSTTPPPAPPTPPVTSCDATLEELPV
jgi:hypothetical protein